jgi:beta-alanine degradation protein BauB
MGWAYMKKIALLSVATSLVAGAFVAGVAVGKAEPPAKAKFIAVEEVKWDDVGGPKIGQLTGDYKKGPYTGLLKLPAGFTSPLHSHTGTYEAVEISGTSSHWLKGEDGTKAKKMTPGSYWTITGKADHVSSCAPGADCVIFVWQKTKFDFVLGKEDKAAAGAGSGAGSAASKTGAGAAVKVDVKAGAGAGAGSAAKK